MTRYQHNRKEMLRKRAMKGVAARERKRIERSESMCDVGGFVTDGCLGIHSVRLLAYPGDERSVAVTVDGRHRAARTFRGVVRCMASMVMAATCHAGALTRQDALARTIYFEDSRHPATVADTLWNRAARSLPRLADASAEHRSVLLVKLAMDRKQFSAWNSGRIASLRIPSSREWRRCRTLAYSLIDGSYSPQTEATHYHRADVRVYWTRGMTFLGRVGRHLLYKKGA